MNIVHNSAAQWFKFYLLSVDIVHTDTVRDPRIYHTVARHDNHFEIIATINAAWSRPYQWLRAIVTSRDHVAKTVTREQNHFNQ